MPDQKKARVFRGLLATCLIGLTAGCASAVSEMVSAEGLQGVRWGIVVQSLEGRTLVARGSSERFTPASNTKLFVTAAAMHRIGGADVSAGTSVWLEQRDDGPPDVVLLGGGDATLSDAPDCVANCLAQLADAVVASGVSQVRAVIGDDRLFPDERWGPGMSWNNIQTRSGTASGALVVNDNEVVIEVSPGAVAGQPAVAKWRAGDEFMRIDNAAQTSADGTTNIGFDRKPNSGAVRVVGAIAPGAAVQRERLGVDDPALFAAWRLQRLLEARGVEVAGPAEARHRAVELLDDPAVRKERPAPLPPVVEGTELARLQPAPLADDVRITLKVSQNMHADVLLRRLGRIAGGGSFADGVEAMQGVLAEAGMERTAYDFADGSGMSTYNRVTPAMVTAFLRWTQQQTWGEAWRAMLPVGGIDGTLTRRFAGTPLQGRIFAKTGTLNATNALSGFMLGKSGRMLVFSVYANDQPSGAGSATAAMDRALVAIAEAY